MPSIARAWPTALALACTPAASPANTTAPAASTWAVASAPSPDSSLSIASEGTVGPQKEPYPGAKGASLPSYEEGIQKGEGPPDAPSLSMTECVEPVGGDVASSCGLQGTAKLRYVVQRGKVLGASCTTEPPQPNVEKCMVSALATRKFASYEGFNGCVRTFKVN